MTPSSQIFMKNIFNLLIIICKKQFADDTCVRSVVIVYSYVPILEQLSNIGKCLRSPIHSSPTDGRNGSFSPSILPSFRNLFILGDFNCHHPLWESTGFSDPRGNEIFDWVFSSALLLLNDPDISTLLHRSSDIFFAPFSLALSCSWEMLQELGSDNLPILLSVSLWSFAPKSVPLPLIFTKLAGIALPSTLTLTLLLQRNIRLFLFPLLLLSLSLWH